MGVEEDFHKGFEGSKEAPPAPVTPEKMNLEDRGEMVLSKMAEKGKALGARLSGFKDKMMSIGKNILGAGHLAAEKTGDAAVATVDAGKSAVEKTVGAGHWLYEKAGQLKDTAINKGKEAFKNASEKVKNSSVNMYKNVQRSGEYMKLQIKGTIAEFKYGAEIDQLLKQLSEPEGEKEAEQQASFERLAAAQKSGEDPSTEFRHYGRAIERTKEAKFNRELAQQKLDKLSARYYELVGKRDENEQPATAQTAEATA